MFHATKASLFYAIHPGVGGATLLAGWGVDNGQELSESIPVVSALPYTEGAHAAAVSPVTGSVFTPDEVPGTPVGVTDIGGGGQDLLLMGVDVGDL